MATSTSKLNIPEDEDGCGFVNWIHQKSRFLTKVIALTQIVYGLAMNVLVLQALLTIIIVPFRSEINIMSGADVKMLLTLAGGSLFWSLFIVVGGILYMGVINMDIVLLRFWVVCNAVIMVGNLIHVIIFHEGLEIFARWNYGLIVDCLCIYIVSLHMVTVTNSQVENYKNEGENLTTTVIISTE